MRNMLFEKPVVPGGERCEAQDGAASQYKEFCSVGQQFTSYSLIYPTKSSAALAKIRDLEQLLDSWQVYI